MKTADLISFGSLLLAFISLVWTGYNGWKLKKQQEKINEQQEKINEYVIQDFNDKEKNKKKAQITISSRKTSKNRHCIYFENKGESEAKNFNIISDDIINPNSQLRTDTNLPFLKNVFHPKEKISITIDNDYDTSLSSVRITATWDDDFKKGNKEEQTIELS